MTIRNATGIAAQEVVSQRSLHALQAKWYVVQTKPHQEFRAMEQLQRQHYDCYLPTLQVTKLCRGKPITIVEPLFPRYLFIHLDALKTNWGPIRSTRGVRSMVIFGERFATLPDNYVSALQKMEKISATSPFASGEQRAMIGPFSALHGLYQLPDGQARAFALIELIRQPQILSFAHHALRMGH